MTPTMPTKMQQKSHNLWGNVAEIPKKKPKSMDLLGFLEPLESRFTISVVKSSPKWIKIDLWVIILKSSNFE